jgi:hypothetical protein
MSINDLVETKDTGIQAENFIGNYTNNIINSNSNLNINLNNINGKIGY